MIKAQGSHAVTKAKRERATRPFSHSLFKGLAIHARHWALLSTLAPCKIVVKFNCGGKRFETSRHCHAHKVDLVRTLIDTVTWTCTALESDKVVRHTKSKSV